jgi:hypothetical protein
MSLDCPILYTTTHDSSRWRTHSIQDVKLLEYSIHLPGIHTFSEILNASVTVEAHLKSFWYQHCPHSKQPYIYDMNGEKIESLLLDDTEDDTQTKKSCAGLWVTQRHF